MFRLDRQGVITRPRERASALLASRPDVLEVRLFGSLGRGQGRPGSDADLLVVVRAGAPPFLERIAGLAGAFTGTGIGCDAIVYTESEWLALARGEGAFARAVLRDGQLLAERPRAAGPASPASPRRAAGDARRGQDKDVPPKRAS